MSDLAVIIALIICGMPTLLIFARMWFCHKERMKK